MNAVSSVSLEVILRRMTEMSFLVGLFDAALFNCPVTSDFGPITALRLLRNTLFCQVLS